MPDSVIFDLHVLEGWAGAILEANGASVDAAKVTAASLVDAERRGISTHGLAQLRQYLPRLRAGAIDGSSRALETVTDLGGLAVVDGRNGLGAHVMADSIDVACEKARDAGAAVVLVRNSNHFGAASWFTNRAANSGCFAIVLSNSDPGMATAGSLRPVLGTNPLAIAAPPGNEGDVPSLDIATSAVALGKVRLASQRGESIPLGWAIGADGQPTTDPGTALEGSMLPMGGHKGFGLAFMIDVLVGAVAGSNMSPSIGSDAQSSTPQRVGHAIVAIQVGQVRPIREYSDELDALVGRLRASPRRPGADPVLFPGESEARVCDQRQTHVPIEPAAVMELEALGQEYGRPFPRGDS